MAEELYGNCLIAQSGGPTTVINSTLAGVISEALNHPCIEEIYGAHNGILGILQENLIDLAEESQQTIRALRYSPASALGTSRYKLRKSGDMDRIIEVFRTHNIRFFFYIGGNDSQDTAQKIGEACNASGHELRVIGLPKTVDNDLVHTDHTPGYGSIIKYVSTMVREIAADNASMGQHDLVFILEVMGRNAGWVAAGSSLAKRRDHPEDPPHLIYLPEVPFHPNKFLDDVSRVLHNERFCFVVVGEGLVDDDGNYISTQAGEQDAFGHSQLGGAGEYLKGLVEQHISGVRCRTSRPGHHLRAAVHYSSQTDNDEAFMAGQAGVRAAVAGESGKMVTLLRGDSDTYTCETGLTPLEDVANGVKTIPQNWINDDGVSMNFQFVKYAQPLIQGEVEVPTVQGLPVFAQLGRVRVSRQLPAHDFE